jgi:hypothetical protein
VATSPRFDSAAASALAWQQALDALFEQDEEAGELWGELA